MEGDRAGGIKTLPVILGMQVSQFMIGAAFLVSYILIARLFHSRQVLVYAVAVGLVEFFLINRKDYKEGPVFVVYLFSLGFILFTLAAQ